MNYSRRAYGDFSVIICSGSCQTSTLYNAADEICVSQSALSHQISKLEHELGIQLFKRTTRAVYLTPAGNEFVKYAAHIISEVSRAKHAMRQYTLAERGELIIGSIPIIGLLGIASDIAFFQGDCPNLQVNIQEDFSSQLLDMLLSSAIDVAIMTPPSNSEDYNNIIFSPLICDKLVLTIPADHPLSKKELIDLSETKNEKFIFMKPNNGLHTIALDACRNSGFEPHIVHQNSQVETVLSFVAAGVGVALMTLRVAKFFHTLSYQIIKINNAPKRITALAYLRQNSHSPAITAFRSFMMKRYNLSSL